MRNSKKSLFVNVRSLTFCAMLVALSVILGFIGRTFFTFGSGVSAVRITFENMPVILSGIIFGPVAGGIVGTLCDLVSCLVAPQPSINPFITLGSCLIGVFSGLIFKYLGKSKLTLPRVFLSALPAHLIGSVLVKTYGFYAYYSYPFVPTLILRLGIYTGIGIAESLFLYYVLKNKNIAALIRSILNHSEKRR